jgi:hypothetical protein
LPGFIKIFKFREFGVDNIFQSQVTAGQRLIQDSNPPGGKQFSGELFKRIKSDPAARLTGGVQNLNNPLAQ